MKEGGGLVGGTCEHCEDRAPSGPRQDSVRTLSGLCQDSVRTLSGLSGQLRELHKPGWAAMSRSPDPEALPAGRLLPFLLRMAAAIRDRGGASYDVTYSDPPPWGIVFSWQTSRSQPADLRSRRPPMRSRGWPTALASC